MTKRAQRRVGRQMHDNTLWRVGCAPLPLAQQPDFRREVPLPPLVGRGDAQRREPGAARRCAPVAPRHRPPRRGGQPARRPALTAIAASRGAISAARARTTGPVLNRVAAAERRRPTKTPDSTRSPTHTAAAADAAWRATPHVAEFRIAEHRRDREARRAHLPQQRQRVPPLFLVSRRRRECARARAGPASAIPRADTAARPATSRGRRSTTPRSSPLGNSRSCQARHSTGARRRPRRPLFRKLVPSRINTPARSGITARNRRQTRRPPRARA